MMAQRIPNSSLVIMEGTGHGAMWQVPNELAANIKNFLGDYRVANEKIVNIDQGLFF